MTIHFKTPGHRHSRAFLWFWRVFGFGVVLVLSEAVLVIVIDRSMVLRAGFGDPIESRTVLATTFTVAFGDVQRNRMSSTQPLFASVTM